jgi:hypothetical protein
MRNWFIKILGGYTKKEYQGVLNALIKSKRKCQKSIKVN